MNAVLGRLPALRSAGRIGGITSVCSAHPAVIKAALRHGRDYDNAVLIEATCNQVNQDGGYTGMRPSDFRAFVLRIAAEEGFDPSRLILGGDHLGPNPWRQLQPEAALAKAEAMVAAYVAAGFSKLHLDASMGCLGEPEALGDEATARRAARLAEIAEETARGAGLPPPFYVIGTEVPTPGGALHELDGLTPTGPEAALETIATHRTIFAENGLADAFERVIAIVVQPGVEFGHEDVVVYRPERAEDLVRVLGREGALVFEAHSTDYQPRESLAALVRDGFAILKVGPGLTFALREALYGLDLIASELDPAYGQRALATAMEALMLAEPGQWQRYYPGDAGEQRVLRHYSYSDRIRYYWPHPAAEAAVSRLFATFGDRPIAQTLLSQFVPAAADAVRAGELRPEAKQIARFAVTCVLEDYRQACQPGTPPRRPGSPSPSEVPG